MDKSINKLIILALAYRMEKCGLLLAALNSKKHWDHSQKDLISIGAISI